MTILGTYNLGTYILGTYILGTYNLGTYNFKNKNEKRLFIFLTIFSKEQTYRYTSIIYTVQLLTEADKQVNVVLLFSKGDL